MFTITGSSAARVSLVSRSRSGEEGESYKYCSIWPRPWQGHSSRPQELLPCSPASRASTPSTCRHKLEGDELKTTEVFIFFSFLSEWILQDSWGKCQAVWYRFELSKILINGLLQGLSEGHHGGPLPGGRNCESWQLNEDGPFFKINSFYLI